MQRLTIGTLTGAALLFTAGSVHAQWADNFDSYAQNSFLPGQGGWEEWANNPVNTATKVKDVPSGAAVRSAPHSIWVRGQSDTIYDWDKLNVGTYSAGKWTFCGHIYKPLTTTGFVMNIPSFWIMLNKYQHSGTGNNWSLQLEFDPLTGNYTADIDSGDVTGPCAFDQWVEVRAEIDLNADLVEIFYDGISIGAPYQWNGGSSGFGTGDTKIDTLDLYADGATSGASRVYWDDLSLQPGFNGCNVVTCSSNPVNYCTPGTSASGCQATLSAVGAASASGAGTFTLSATNVEGDKDGLFFTGVNGQQANGWGNSSSFQCVVTPVKRLGTLGKSGTSGNCDGAFSQEINAYWQAFPNKNPGPGATVNAQLWYRDPQNTSNQTTSLSDGLSFTVCP